MITPKAFGFIIKHIDDIDKVVSSRTTRKRPWIETALTSLLCDLMDEETQSVEKLNYTIKNLQTDLENEDGLYGINLALDTIEFSSFYERYISQSDVGLKIIFENKIEPQLSWTKSYLLQAKRLIPIKNNPLMYSEASKFSSVDKEQQKRIEILNKILESSYLKYLLYCPRPDSLDEEMKIKLSYLRNKNLHSHIFDYTIGLELYKELLDKSETLKAGMFITDISNSSINFGQVHNNILSNVFPFSWFIAMSFNDRDFHREREFEKHHSHPSDSLVEGILCGDRNKLEEVIKKIKEVSNDIIPDNFQIFPKHSLTLRFSLGEKINGDRRFIRS